jgi:predicted RNA methylase
MSVNEAEAAEMRSHLRRLTQSRELDKQRERNADPLKHAARTRKAAAKTFDDPAAKAKRAAAAAARATKADFDQFFTKHEIALWCYAKLVEVVPEVLGKHFIEPGAGAGAFFSLLPPQARTGVDLQPQGEGIIQADFLTWQPPVGQSEDRVVIGNPPFGRRSQLAVAFFNRAAEMADVVAFIVPVQFQKYSVQKQLNPAFSLVGDYALVENAFETPEGKDYNVRTTFQIWTRWARERENLRILESPPIHHPDFIMYQYNNTKGALKVFDEDWDFAVPRQGFEDYTRREFDAQHCERQKQWILFKAKNLKILQRLLVLDFGALARKNTVVYGFGKADVVKEYTRLYGA